MERNGTKAFGQAVQTAMTSVAASQEHVTKPSTGWDDTEHRKAFVQMFKRWGNLFKRKDGDVEDDKWLIAEYYKSLKHLTPEGFTKLTDGLKEKCIFFPTIRECLEVITCKDRYDWSHPFRGNPPTLVRQGSDRTLLTAPVRQLSYDRSYEPRGQVMTPEEFAQAKAELEKKNPPA